MKPSDLDLDAKHLVNTHFWLMGVWALMLIPTYLFWRESILLVLFCSLYANFVGHFSGWDAARAEMNTPTMKDFKRLERKVDTLLQK